MTDTIPKLENNNTVLISFDAIIDIYTGIYQCIYDDFKDKHNPYINYEYFNLIDNDTDLQGIRIESLNNEDLISSLLLGEAKESKNDIIKDYIVNEEERVYLKSQITDILRLIRYYNKTDVIKTIVCCENKCQENILRKILDSNVTIRVTDDFKSINLDSIGRIIIGNAETLLKFGKIRMKNICVLDFTNNFQIALDKDGNEKRILNPILLYYWDQNNIEIMNPYRS